MSGQRSEGWLQQCPLSYYQARCIHPPSAECYAIQAFSIASDFDPKRMPKVQYQITMRKVCIVIQSLLSRSPLIPGIALSEAVKGHWTQEGYEGPFGTRGQTVLRPKAYVDLQPLGLTGREEKSDSPFVSTLRPPSRTGPGMQVFQQASSSPDQVYPDPRCVYVGYRPAYGPSALHLPRAIWRGIVAVPTDVP